MSIVVHNDITSTVLLSDPGQDWVLASDASIVTNGQGIIVYASASQGSVTIEGSVFNTDSSASGTSALYVGAKDTAVSIAAGAVLVSSSPSASLEVFADDDVVKNSGSILALGIADGVHAQDGNAFDFENDGYVFGSNAIFTNMQTSHIVNAAGGQIIGLSYGILSLSDNTTITNHGLIRKTTGAYAYALHTGEGADNVVNDGEIYGNISLNGGDDIFDNRGGFVDGSIEGGAGNDMLIVDDADYTLSEKAGGGSDTIKSSVTYTLPAFVETLILIGSADISGTGTASADTITGNSGDNRIFGGSGDDTLNGGAGNDVLTGGDGSDAFSGGSGSDTVSYNSDVTANLLDRTFNTGEAEGDFYKSIENLIGSSGTDRLTGNDSNNKLSGGAGSDTLAGGMGTDFLDGGYGADTFSFKRGESGKTKSAADTIHKFASSDHIDLTGWDANSSASGRQSFDFIGTGAFSGHAGELRFVKGPSETWIEGDTNGDKKIDFYIHLDTAITVKVAYFDL